MKSVIQFAKTTIVGGLIVLLPVCGGLMLVSKVLHTTAKILNPITKHLAIDQQVVWALLLKNSSRH